MKVIVFLASNGNSYNCIQTYENVTTVRECTSEKMCIFRGPEYKKGCGGVIIDGDHLYSPVKVEVIP